MACPSIKDDDVSGTSTDQAAEALTKAISFMGGELVEGLIPSSTDSDVSLLPATGESLLPGGDSLMSFEINPGDTNVESALIQFQGAKQHFEVDGSVFGGAADGGIPDAGTEDKHVELSYSIDDAVCDKLCNEKYTIKVTQAVRLRGTRISKHASATITLDCSVKGDAKFCGSSGSDDEGGDEPGISPEAEKLVKGYYMLQSSVCACVGAGEMKMCDPPAAAVACTTKAFDEHLGVLEKQLPCLQSFVTDQQACIDAAGCDPNKLAGCTIVASMMSESSSPDGMSGDGPEPFEAECGPLPPDLQADVDVCGATHACDDGTPVPQEDTCNGIDDCPNGEDERNCGIPNQMFGCLSGEVLTADKLCDRTTDCADGSDESGAVCMMCTDNADKIYSFNQHCDGISQCGDGSDELGCDYPCADGKQTIPLKSLCNGTPDCSDASDEAFCGKPGELPCGDGTSVPVELYCNGRPECANGNDEMGCPTTDSGDGAGGTSGGAAGASSGAGGTSAAMGMDAGVQPR